MKLLGKSGYSCLKKCLCKNRILQTIRGYVPVPPDPPLTKKDTQIKLDRQQKRCLEEKLFPRRLETPPHTQDRKFKQRDFPSHVHDEAIAIDKSKIDIKDKTDPIHPKYPKQENYYKGGTPR